MAEVSFRHGARHVTFVDIKLEDARDEAEFMLTSDEHLDNTHCEQQLYKRHLDYAKKHGMKVIQNGDLFCAMQGKYDRRSDRSQLRPELQGNDYLDALVTYNTRFLEPYADMFIVIGRGNHETSILKHHETDLTERLVGVLNDRTGSNILSGGYGGWIFFRCTRGSHRHTFKMYRHHGHGGAAPMTKGVLDSVRMAATHPDVDVVVTGHKHTRYVFPVPRTRINSYGRITYDEQLHVRVPGYKASLDDHYEGWEVEKGFPPSSLGSMILEIGYEYDSKSKGGSYQNQFTIDVRRMK